ncbi:MAG TPA: hypothetical protein VEY89_09675, partial [Candidatus Dormibacteraeota bacterium]|nr:hypothetical protein [Candidatus Dormibacteraeota bacterium]
MALLAEDLDRAEAELVRAAELDPYAAAVFNDLAVVHLARATAMLDPRQLLLALAAGDRAITLAPALAAGHFNRAVALSRLSLNAQAAAEWILLARRERDGGWLAEARRRAAVTTGRRRGGDWRRQQEAVEAAVGTGRSVDIGALVRRSRERFRKHVEETLLPRWAVAQRAGRVSDATRTLAVGRAIALALSESGEVLDLEAINQIERLYASRSPEVGRIAAGLAAYRQGLDLAQRGQFAGAHLRFVGALRLLAAGRSPFAHWARFQLAVCSYQESDYPRARNQLSRVIESAKRFKALTGHAWWMLGLIDSIEGRTSAALSALSAAETAFTGIGESSNSARISAMIADSFRTLGDLREAWRRLLPALVEPGIAELPELRFGICEIASWLAQDEAATGAALAFQEEVVQTSLLLGRTELAVSALRGRAALLAQAGNMAAAAEDLAQARQRVTKVADARLRKCVEGDLALVAGQSVLSSSPRQAIAWLDRAV